MRRDMLIRFLALSCVVLFAVGCAETPCEEAFNSQETCSAEAGVELDRDTYVGQCQADIDAGVVATEDVRCVGQAAGDCDMIADCK